MSTCTGVAIKLGFHNVSHIAYQYPVGVKLGVSYEYISFQGTHMKIRATALVDPAVPALIYTLPSDCY